MKWRLRSKGRFYDPNEDQVVYFDPSSGDTHLLSQFAAHVLRQIGDNSRSAAELANDIAPSYEGENDAQLEDAVRGIIEALAALEILEST